MSQRANRVRRRQGLIRRSLARNFCADAESIARLGTSSSELLPREPPEKSAVEIIAPEALKSEILQSLASVWKANRERGGMPRRASLLPRGIGNLLKYVSLVRVVPERSDYEFRIIGDIHVQAYGTRHQGKCLSDVAKEAPKFARMLQRSLDAVVKAKKPIAYRGIIGRDAGDSRFIALESVFLPLSEDGTSVDHIMTAGIYTPRGGYWTDAPAIV